MGFAQVLRGFVGVGTMPLAAYLAVGFLVSQFFNIYVYHAGGGTTLMTWHRMAGLTAHEPSILLVSQLCVLMAVFVFLAFQLFSYYARDWPSLSVLHRSAALCACLLLVSQAMFSSVMRLSYETLFCFVAIAALVIGQAFLRTPTAQIGPSSAEYAALWDVLKFIVPVCLGVPILMGGAGFITAFYQSEQELVRLQLYRHIAMALYFEVGAGLFLIYPVLRRVLIARGQ